MDDHVKKTLAQNTQIIRHLNDQMRTTGQGGKMVLTRGVAALAPDTLAQLINAVRTFDTFTRDNDPWGEHDFGGILLDGQQYFWTINAYDLNLEYGSPDPTDPTVTRRLLTILMAEEL